MLYIYIHKWKQSFSMQNKAQLTVKCVPRRNAFNKRLSDVGWKSCAPSATTMSSRVAAWRRATTSRLFKKVCLCFGSSHRRLTECNVVSDKGKQIAQLAQNAAVRSCALASGRCAQRVESLARAVRMNQRAISSNYTSRSQRTVSHARLPSISTANRHIAPAADDGRGAACDSQRTANDATSRHAQRRDRT